MTPQTRCLGGCSLLIPINARKGRCAACLSRLDAQRNAISPSVRRLVIANANGECEVRRPGCKGKATEVDHIVPLSKNGTETMGNYQAACKSCNSGKRDR